MKIQPLSSDSLPSPSPVASKLPPQILDRAAAGFCWVSLFAAVTSVALTAIQHVLQPEFAAAWAHPALRMASLAVVFLSVGCMVVLRQGWLTKERLLDLAMAFQVMIAFACGLFEAAAYQDPNAVVLGHSGVAVWMMLCGFLMPTAPLRALVTAFLCVSMWPLAYWVDLRIFHYEPITASRMLLWILPLVIVAVWMYILNNRVISMYVRQQRAEDVGSYILDSRIGRGGMGEVWRARHKTLARAAAIKLIRPEVLRTSTGRQEHVLRRRFEREAQVTASLSSPHTVALYDFGQAQDGSFYYVMELLEGIDLQTLVDRFGPMDPARVVHLLYQACQSLEEAHRAGLVHRDIKPRNILLCKLGLEYDFTKLLDFGLVKTLYHDDADRTITTMEGITTGTPAYLPPEIAMGNREIDGRADLYSLGCTAYFLLTGHTVFEEKSPTAFAIAHVQTPPPPMRERTELPIPAGLEALVMQLLAKQPAERIPSAQELARRLRSLRDVPGWTPEQAEAWWETNLPERPLAALPAGEAEATSTVAAARA
jgi:tRNA A-37 threonylcarbamoyl transferase component Bud32